MEQAVLLACSSSAATTPCPAFCPQATCLAAASLCLQSHDVVSYFTQHGHSATKKLFYLNKATRG